MTQTPEEKLIESLADKLSSIASSLDNDEASRITARGALEEIRAYQKPKESEIYSVFYGLGKEKNPALVKASVGEPLFVIRATDEMASRTIDFWAESVRAVYRGNRISVPEEKLTSAEQSRRIIRQWQVENGSKLPD